MRALTLVLALAISSCIGSPTDEHTPDLGVQMIWLGATQSGIPAEISTIEVQRADAEGTIDEGATATYTVSRLEDLDDDGRPELAQSQLPINTPFSLVIVARDASGTITHRGRLGPLTLLAGERRYVPIYLYPINEAVAVTDMTYSFGAFTTVTTLADGRALVSGGFKDLEDTECPAGVPSGSQCISAQATREAYLFDPATAQFHEVEGGMVVARGGHTATALPDGRVLVAGGAEAGVFVFAVSGTGGADTINFDFIPRRADGSDGAHANFEVFDPRLGAEDVDFESNGDPGRGLFVRGSDPAAGPSPLNHERCLHAAAAVPATGAGTDTQVLLAGGVGNGDAAQTYEIYDDRRPGGPGVYSNIGARLGTARRMPGALGMPGLSDGPILIVGGGPAANAAELADLWRPDPGQANGQIVAATAAEGSTFAMEGSSHGGAAYAYMRPALANRDDNEELRGTGVFVLGWYGPLCDSMTMTPVFSGGASPTDLCTQNASGSTFGYQVRGAALQTVPGVSQRARAFATATRLDNGRIALTGGIARRSFIAQNGAELIGYTGTSGTGSVTLPIPRMFHDAAALPGGGIIIVGGMLPSRAGLARSADVAFTR